MKSILIKVGIAIAAILVIGFMIDTGSVTPPDNTLVFVDPQVKHFYPPTRTPANQGYKETAYILAKRMGAKPDDSRGFNVDGPPLIIDMLLDAGVISFWPSYWHGTNVALEFYDKKVVEQMKNAL